MSQGSQEHHTCCVRIFADCIISETCGEFSARCRTNFVSKLSSRNIVVSLELDNSSILMILGIGSASGLRLCALNMDI